MNCPSCGTEVWGNIKTCPVCEQSLDIKRPNKNKKEKGKVSLSTGLDHEDYFQPDPGETIIEHFKAARIPIYVAALTVIIEYLFISAPVLASAFNSSDNSFLGLPFLETILFAIGLFFMLLIVHYYALNRAARRRNYYITDKRVIAIRNGHRMSLRSMPINEIVFTRMTRGMRVASVVFSNASIRTLSENNRANDNTNRNSISMKLKPTDDADRISRNYENNGMEVSVSKKRHVRFAVNDVRRRLIVFHSISREDATKAEQIVNKLINDHESEKP